MRHAASAARAVRRLARSSSSASRPTKARRGATHPRGRIRATRAHEPPARDAARLSLGRTVISSPNSNAPPTAAAVRLAHQHLTGRRSLLEPRADVDSIPRSQTTAPSVDGRRPPRPYRHRSAASRPPNTSREPALHRQRRVKRPLGVILVRRGAPKAAITASPTNFSTVPPARSISAAIAS